MNLFLSNYGTKWCEIYEQLKLVRIDVSKISTFYLINGKPKTQKSQTQSKTTKHVCYEAVQKFPMDHSLFEISYKEINEPAETGKTGILSKQKCYGDGCENVFGENYAVNMFTSVFACEGVVSGCRHFSPSLQIKSALSFKSPFSNDLSKSG